MAIQGYNARVYLTGTSTAMTDEPMSQSGSSDTYYTTDADRNLWDPETAVVVEDNSSVVATSNYTVDFLLGEVTFAASYTVTGPVTVTAAFLPKFLITTARSATLSITFEDLDETVLGDTSMSRRPGLSDANGTVEQFDIGNTDYDTVGSSGVTIFDALDARETKVVEFQPDTNDDEVWRVMCRFFSDEFTADVADLITGSLTYQGTLVGALTDSFSYGDPTA